MNRNLQVKIDLLLLLVQKDLRLRYRGSVFGYLWSILNPLLYMIVLTAVFSYVMRFKIENYPIFLLSGIVVWNLFHQSVMQGVNSIIGNGGLIKKVKVPIALFPTATVAAVTVHFSLSLVAFLAISIGLGHYPQWIWLVIPVYLGIFLVFILGVTLLVASLNVSFRDVGHTLDPILQLFFYATPIIYPVSVLPDRIKFLINLNPLTHYIGSIRSIFFDYTLPSTQTTLFCSGTSLLVMAIGWASYRKLRGDFVYQL